jgi:histidinol-phosphate aminotransferase
VDVRDNFRRSVLELAPYAVSGHPAKIKLNQNESPFDVPEALKKEIIDEFIRKNWNRYPEVFSVELPKRLSEIHGLPSDSFIVANGSNELIYTVAISIVREGTEVLIPQPTFYFFEKISRILGGEIRKVYADGDLNFDEKGILATGRKMKNGLIIIGSPNNPTGKSVSREFIVELLKSTGAIVLLDEAYIEFSDKPSSVDLVGSNRNLVILRTFSKAFSLAGLRMGYLVAHPETAFEILKVKIPVTVNPLSEFTALKLLEHRALFADRVKLLKEQRAFMTSRLRVMEGVRVIDSDANFFLFSTPLPAGRIFEELLERQSVLVRDVSSYPLLERYLRVNAGTEEESAYFIRSMLECLERLAV